MLCPEWGLHRSSDVSVCVCLDTIRPKCLENRVIILLFCLTRLSGAACYCSAIITRLEWYHSLSCCLTHWGRDKMAAIFLTTSWNAFSLIKMCEFRLRFHWNVFGRFELTIFHHWFWYWLGADQATSHYLSQWWLDYWRIYASLGLNELNVFLHQWNLETHILERILEN